MRSERSEVSPTRAHAIRTLLWSRHSLNSKLRSLVPLLSTSALRLGSFSATCLKSLRTGLDFFISLVASLKSATRAASSIAGAGSSV
jgi:hypothetical protein